jgi:hypothetical protein
MNSPITFPPAAPTLKLTRAPVEKWAATLTEERRRLQEDQEALREREANLRDYESRLRTLQAEIEAGRTAPTVTARMAAAPFVRPASRAPFATDAALQVAWEKLHRAREILESEQRHMSEERVTLRDQQAEVKQRLEELVVREASVVEREQLLAAAHSTASEPIASEHTMSAMTRLTRAPFDMARSVFGGKK